MELWQKFWSFGGMGEVFNPKRVDKQGRHFGFVKFRDVRDDVELLGGNCFLKH
jgi:hypothetical protein